MRHRSVQSRAASVTAAAVLAMAGFGVSAAQAGFVLDLKVHNSSASTASVSANGSVDLDVFGTITGTGAAADGIQDAFFGVTNSGTVGDLTVVSLASPFNGVTTDGTNVTTSQPGVLYGPTGGKSVGSTDSAVADNWVFARSTSMTAATDGTPVLLGTLKFNAGSSAGSTNLAINTRTASSLVVPAVWSEDGVEKDGTPSIGTGVSITVTATAPHHPGDTNNDHVIDLTDLNNVLNNFGVTAPGNPGDDNSDGTVDLTDLNNVLNNFGVTYAASGLSTVPEPASLSLVGLGAAALIGRRRRK